MDSIKNVINLNTRRIANGHGMQKYFLFFCPKQINTQHFPFTLSSGGVDLVPKKGLLFECGQREKFLKFPSNENQSNQMETLKTIGQRKQIHVFSNGTLTI